MHKTGLFVGGAMALALLSGCAAALATKVVSSSPRSVVVKSFDGIADAQSTANTACAKYDRFARWVSGEQVDFYFDCVN